ncbi:MAG: type II toxin-antitoxin system HicA family toxin [Dehalococcoidia bacterium]|nr:type II toxin-antitoxin system HicA family toxin [Dehalococcoidia bacterium]
MKFTENTWKQLKNKTTDELIAALLKDGFVPEGKLRTERVYRHPSGKKVTIHYHSGSATYSPGLLKALLQDIGWSEADMRRLKLIR